MYYVWLPWVLLQCVSQYIIILCQINWIFWPRPKNSKLNKNNIKRNHQFDVHVMKQCNVFLETQRRKGKQSPVHYMWLWFKFNHRMNKRNKPITVLLECFISVTQQTDIWGGVCENKGEAVERADCSYLQAFYVMKYEDIAAYYVKQFNDMLQWDETHNKTACICKMFSENPLKKCREKCSGLFVWIMLLFGCYHLFRLYMV